MNSFAAQVPYDAIPDDTSQGPETELPEDLMDDYGRLPDRMHLARYATGESDNETQGNIIGQDTGEFDVDRLVAPLSARRPPPSPLLRARSFNPLMEWEGYVESIGDEDFVVKMADVRSENGLPSEMATFSKEDLNEYDKDLLQEGAIVRWVIGMERLASGQRRRVSMLHFRRLPAHTAADFARAKSKAQELIQAIDWDEST